MGTGAFARSVENRAMWEAARTTPAWKWWLVWGEEAPELQTVAVRVLAQVLRDSR
jgi:hypothetical protein